MAQRAIRFSETTGKRIQEATEKRGFPSPTEERLVASIDQVKGDLLVPGRSQQALFALVYCLAKILLTCIPEPDIHALEVAASRAQGRHARLLKSAGQAMGADSRLAIQELVKHAER